MKLKNFINKVAPYLPVVFSLAGGFGIWYALLNFLPDNPETLNYINDALLIITFISVFLICIFIFFIYTKANQLRFTGNTLGEEITQLTQKMHHFRNIVDILVRSKVWNPGLKEYIDEEFSDLNFFQMKEFYKGRSKIALEFIEENNRYGETENLYLEAKSLLLNDPSRSKVDGFTNPRLYDKDILSKWVEHKCGSGLWYYFGYKYSNFKDELDVNRVFERHQDKIVSYAVQLDTRRYQDSGFSEELLSKIGEQMSEEIIPRLFTLTMQAHQKLPGIINTVYSLLLIILLFGVFLPLATLLFQLPVMFGLGAIAIVLTILLFIVLSIYPYVSKEINSGR